MNLSHDINSMILNTFLKRSKLARLSSQNLTMAQFSNATDEFIYKFNKDYESKHKTYEDHFWSNKMNLKGCSGPEEASSKNDLDAFLGNKEVLEKVRSVLKQPDITSDQEKILKCFEKTLLCYIVEDPAVVELKNKINVLEAELACDRNQMELGYTNLDGQFVKASSVQLRNLVRTSDNEALRKSCLEGLRSIGPFVAPKFVEIVKLRNQVATMLGFEDL